VRYHSFLLFTAFFPALIAANCAGPFMPDRRPNHICHFNDSFSYKAGLWSKKWQIVANVEWQSGCQI